MNRKGLILKDQHFIYSSCNSIALCERYGVASKDLIKQLYILGLLTFRRFHKVGLPADIWNPGLEQPARDGSKVNRDSV